MSVSKDWFLGFPNNPDDFFVCGEKNDMAISAEKIKELREKTGASISDIKKSLEESGDDLGKAQAAIERKLGSSAGKRLGRETKAGLVEAYIHSNGRVGSMVELFCETDFVARNSGFKELAHGLALHIAAMCPRYLSLENIPPEIWEEEKRHFEEEFAKLNKPPQLLKEIIEGKLKSHFQDIVLTEQPFVKDQDKTVGEIVREAIGKFGENIKIGKFIRFEI